MQVEALLIKLILIKKIRRTKDSDPDFPPPNIK